MRIKGLLIIALLPGVLLVACQEEAPQPINMSTTYVLTVDGSGTALVPFAY